MPFNEFSLKGFFLHKKDCKKQTKRKVLGDNYAKRCSSFVKLNLFFYLSICYLDLNSVAYVYFENSGSVSILPKGEQRPTIAVDLVNLKIEKARVFYDIQKFRFLYSLFKYRCVCSV